MKRFWHWLFRLSQSKLHLDADRDVLRLEEVCDEFRSFVEAVNGSVAPEVDQIIQQVKASLTQKCLSPLVIKTMSAEDVELMVRQIKTASYSTERMNLVKRWHTLGVVFPATVRNLLIRVAIYSSEREMYADLFAKQDRR